jgi:uncharacterized membrane protein
VSVGSRVVRAGSAVAESLQRRWWYLDPTGSAVGLLLAIVSVTPSLLPRPALFQGAITAVAFATGYAVGALVWASVRPHLRGRPSQIVQRRIWIGYAVAWVIALIVLSGLSVAWQNEVRRYVEMPPLEGADTALFVAGFIPVAVVLIAIGKGVRRLFRSLARAVGAVVATLGAATVIVAGGAAFVLVVTIAIDAIYLDRNGTPDDDVAEPGSDFRSAGPGSAIAWDDLGRHGAAFVGGGPSASDITALTGVPAREPIRVYAGIASADALHERADLVVAELERTGAFERSVLVVATTTGSGWLEPQTVDALEYVHAGDTAIASMQYAYTPSWISFVFDPDAPVAAARILFDAVEERWLRIPEDERPELYVYGLSLGAHGSQAIFADVAELRGRTDGALFVGSPGGSTMWQTLQAARDAGSPVWQPVLDDGREVRWMSRDGDQMTGVWQSPRVLYLQHATDPVTWLAPELIWRSPEWLDPAQRGPDVSPSMRWIPGVTAVQVTVDMLGGEAVPARHGHNYGDVVTTGWLEVTGGVGLDAAAVDRIRETIEAYAPIPPYAE